MEYQQFLSTFTKIPISGIYSISCLLNNKVYIGSAINIRRRIWAHICDLNTQKHASKEMQEIYNLYQTKYFDFNIVEKVDNDLDLLEREMAIQDNFVKCELFNRADKNKDIVLNDYYLKKFWSWVDKKNDNECWIWLGPKMNNGYGQFHVWKNNKVKNFYPHRISYTLYYNKQIGQSVIDHKCNNRLCVNPCHLELVSHHKNMDRCSKEGRMAGQKYSDDLIRDIRRKQQVESWGAKQIYQYLQDNKIDMPYGYMCRVLCGEARKNVKV